MTMDRKQFDELLYKESLAKEEIEKARIHEQSDTVNKSTMASKGLELVFNLLREHGVKKSLSIIEEQGKSVNAEAKLEIIQRQKEGEINKAHQEANDLNEKIKVALAQVVHPLEEFIKFYRDNKSALHRIKVNYYLISRDKERKYLLRLLHTENVYRNQLGHALQNLHKQLKKAYHDDTKARPLYELVLKIQEGSEFEDDYIPPDLLAAYERIADAVVQRINQTIPGLDVKQPST